jgi:hypothetical protein
MISINVAAAQTQQLSVAPYPTPFDVVPGQQVSYQFAPVGGVGPYQFLRLSGTIPIGLSLSNTGLLSGTIQGYSGTNFTFDLGVMDARGSLAAASVWIIIH